MNPSSCPLQSMTYCSLLFTYSGCRQEEGLSGGQLFLVELCSGTPWGVVWVWEELYGARADWVLLPPQGRGHVGQEDRPVLSLCCLSFADLRVLMDVAESPELDPHSPEDEEQPALSDDDILRESGSEQDLDGAGERPSDLEDEENTTRVQSQETHSDEEDQASEPKSQDQDSEAHELSRGPAGSLCEEGDDAEEDRTSDLRDEASSVTRELDEHELDYDEEVPEEPAPAAQEEEAEKAGAEDEEEKGEGAPREEGKPDVQSVGEKEPTEAAKEKKKEDDDGEIDDGEIDVSMVEQARTLALQQTFLIQEKQRLPCS